MKSQQCRAVQTIKSFLFAFLSIALGALVGIITGAQAGSVSFSQHVHSAIEQLEGKNPQRFDIALNHALLAKEYAINSPARELVEDAAKAMVDWRRPEAAFPSDSNVSLAATYLKNSLRHNRINLNRSSRDELALMKKLIKVHLFPAAFDKVEMTFEGIDESRAIVLLATYLVDPRAAQYDPEVRALVTGERGDGAPATQRVKFVVGGETYDLPANQDAQEMVEKIQASAKKILDSSLPIRPLVSANANQVMISFEIFGFKNIPIVETYVRSVLSIANGNRYIYGAAEKLASLSKAIQTGAVTAPAGLQGVAERTAAAIDVVETVMRSKMMSAGWVEPTVDVIRARLAKGAEIDKSRIAKLLDMDLQNLKNIGATPAEIAARQEQAASAVKAVDQALNGKLGSVDKALGALESSGKLGGKAANVQSSMKLQVAEQAAGVKVITWDRAIKGLSLLITAVHVYNGFQQMSRTPDPAEKLMIWRKTGVKIIHALIYFVPVVGEIASAIDIGGWVLEATVFKMLNIEYDIPDVAALLHLLINWVEDLGYRAGGSTRFGVLKGKFEEALRVGLMVQQEGSWTEPALYRLAGAVAKRKTGEISKRGLREATDRYREQLSEIARKELLLVYLLLDHHYPDGPNRDLGRFIGATQKRWGGMEDSSSYLGSVVNTYESLRPVIGTY